MSKLYEAKEINRLLVRPYLTAYQWPGQSQGGPLLVGLVRPLADLLRRAEKSNGLGHD